MTIDAQVTDVILPQLDVPNEDEAEIPARVESRLRAIELWNSTKFKKTVFVIDIMGMFHHDFTEVKSWDSFFTRCANYVIKQSEGINADVTIVCVDLLVKNEAREFVAQTRRDATKNAIPLRVSPSKIEINLFSTTDFPYKDAPGVDFNTAYRNSSDFKKHFLYPMMKFHFTKYLKGLKSKIILFGFDDRKSAIPKVDDFPEMITIPVEGDFQLMSWLLSCVVKKYQIIIDSFDGDILPALFLQLDRLVALGLAEELHKNQFWWVRSVRKNITHVCVLQAYSVMCGPLYLIKNLDWPGATVALLFFVRGNDYVNVRKETKIDGIDLLSFQKLLLETHSKGPVVYLTVNAVGRVVFEIDHKLLAPVIIQSRRKAARPITQAEATVLCRQMAFCLNYFTIEPLTAFIEDCVSPQMTQSIDGLPYYSYSRILSNNNDFTSSVLCPLDKIPLPNKEVGIDMLGCLINKPKVISIDSDEEINLSPQSEPEKESGTHKRLKQDITPTYSPDLYYSFLLDNYLAWLYTSGGVKEPCNLETFQHITDIVMTIKTTVT